MRVERALRCCAPSSATSIGSNACCTVLGFVACVQGFEQQPAVVDGASRLLADVFGDAGRHSRSAIGVAALPARRRVEIEVEVALRA